MSASNQNKGENPSQLSGHLQYVKGAASEMIGDTLGSASWKDSGRQDKQAAIGQMRTAKEQGDEEMNFSARKASTLSAEGKMQSAAGGLTGCPGMKERGDEKERVAEQKTTEGL